MEFKIDTKQTYTHITPIDSPLSANMAATLRQKCIEIAESGSQNFLIDMCHCTSADNTSPALLVELHELCYGNGQSLVFTNINDDVLQELKKNDINEILNIAPTTIEAIDIISMEILERDLFNEE